MQPPTIIPHLWFDREAAEAARFYATVFPDSAVDYVTRIHDTPSGDCDVVRFTVFGQPFMAISAGPLFQFNPSMSFIVIVDPARHAQARERIDAMWQQLAEGGQVLMPLDAYPFSPHFGWLNDRYGVSWQLMLANPGSESRPAVVPALLFTGSACGQAEAAGTYWRAVFPGSQAGQLVRWGAGMEPEREGSVMFSDFRLGNTWLSAMDSARPHDFGFNEAVSFVVPCEDQAEIDRYWARLSAVPEAEACGWCKDRFGVSWQIVPAEMEKLMRSGEQSNIDRLVQAMLPMKKLDIAALKAAFHGG
ncbi:putative 3-demethylubiquinone-9 3-methyltransferase (glyoxalase superfamily) [Cupriavidus gilardii J11]|uniref:Putative 3-demethylubiquinone-9 3-methyltransferase (Glyoxalase superfamily) n=1 Tax=Cupriavidus gilardii J11 TaxID=936133 RepID=A0A562BBV1_9BURK|nr:VOC family protein [Cupriavidus gilardii]TWG82647.1 putative 3-demethylubiquinone-9 3-methyltransferase (glyoxalase superfamily) [Cupriavidus gilardii J11]